MCGLFLGWEQLPSHQQRLQKVPGLSQEIVTTNKTANLIFILFVQTKQTRYVLIGELQRCWMPGYVVFEQN